MRVFAATVTVVCTVAALLTGTGGSASGAAAANAASASGTAPGTIAFYDFGLEVETPTGANHSVLGPSDHFMRSLAVSRFGTVVYTDDADEDSSAYPPLNQHLHVGHLVQPYGKPPHLSAQTRLALSRADVALSPDGTTIAFDVYGSSCGGKGHWGVKLYVVDTDGSGLHSVAQDPTGDNCGSLSPTWSPNGSTLAFIAAIADPDDPCAEDEVDTVSKSGGHATPVDLGGGDWFLRSIAWSATDRLAATGDPLTPDGNGGCDQPDSSEVYTFPRGGGTGTAVTHTPNRDESWVQWSPDGTALVTSAMIDAYTTGSYTVPSTGGHETKIGTGDWPYWISAKFSRPHFATSVSPTALPPGGTATFDIRHAPARQWLTIERRNGQGWTRIGKVHTTSTGTARIRFRKTGALGTVQLRAVVATPSSTAPTGAAANLKIEKHGRGKRSDHAFLLRDSTARMRWNPCQPIHYRLNLRQAPSTAHADVKETLRRIAQITKIRFVYDGPTRAIPSGSINQKQPLVIAWAKPSQSKLCGDEPNADGVGGGFGNGDTDRLTHGFALINSRHKHLAGFGTGDTEGALLMHELGHAMGLDHATGANEIMYPYTEDDRPAAMYGAGDYRGLQLQGRDAGCNTQDSSTMTQPAIDSSGQDTAQTRQPDTTEGYGY
jgi:hypothetical protein